MATITIHNIDNYNHACIPAETHFDTFKCWARLSSNKSRQCKNNPKCNHFCGVHHSGFLKGKVITIFDDLGINNSDNIKPVIKKVPSIDYSNRDYSIFMDNIVTIQKYIRGFIVRNNIKIRGISVYNRKLCNNDTDCLSLKSIEDIPNKDFYSYKDSNGHYWGFDLVTIKECINNNVGNPYNTLPFTDEVKDSINAIESKMKKPIKLELPKIESVAVKVEQRCVELFQQMDNLKNYTKCDWFLDLSILGLKKLYKEMEDLWNYRLQLTNNDKLRYVKNSDVNLFTLKEFQNIKKINNKHTLSNILLNSFEKLINDGQTESDKATACQWILSGLTLVNEDARNTLPWLYQSAHY